MNQLSGIGFGTDATVLAFMAQTANERLGAFDLIVKNTGANVLTLTIKSLEAGSWTAIGSAITVAAGGSTTTHLSLVSKVIGFFGTGPTTANITTVINTPSDRRGAQIDLVTQGRKGWGYDVGINKASISGNLPADWGRTSSNSGPTTTLV